MKIEVGFEPMNAYSKLLWQVGKLLPQKKRKVYQDLS